MDNSSGGNSVSSSGLVLNPEDLRKRKRMISNRDSARRSRLRKQQHLDGLTAHAALLRKENRDILANLNFVTENYVEMESENAVLRAQAAELGDWLQSLNEIIAFSFAADQQLQQQQPDYGFY